MRAPTSNPKINAAANQYQRNHMGFHLVNNAPFERRGLGPGKEQANPVPSVRHAAAEAGADVFPLLELPRTAAPIAAFTSVLALVMATMRLVQALMIV